MVFSLWTPYAQAAELPVEAKADTTTSETVLSEGAQTETAEKSPEQGSESVLPETAPLSGVKTNAAETSKTKEVKTDTANSETSTEDASTNPRIAKAGTTQNNAPEAPATIPANNVSAANTVVLAAASRAPQDVSQYVHSKISTKSDTFNSGYSVFFTVDYSIDRGQVKPGDYLYISIPADIDEKGVDISANAQHFASQTREGTSSDGKNVLWRLVFGKQAESAIAGSMSILATMNAAGDKTISVGKDSKTVTVHKSAPSSGSGVQWNINKDVSQRDAKFAGYDYSANYGEGSAMVQNYNSDQDKVITYNLYLNGRREHMHDVVATDTLPEGETFVNEEPIISMGNKRMSTSEGDYTLRKDGQIMTITFHKPVTDQVRITYKVLAKGNASGVFYVNNFKVNYKLDGDDTVYQAERDHELIGTGNSAANGIKSVDRTVISENDTNQLVRYSFKFWTSDGAGFAPGKISLQDQLNPYLRFMYADPNPLFDITFKDGVVSISNKTQIQNNKSVTASFVVDFSQVPAGSIISNTNGANTVKTVKAGAVLRAHKELKNQPLKESQFKFKLEQVADVQGNPYKSGTPVTDEATNNAQGNIVFDKLSFDKPGTYYFAISEIAGSDSKYTYDSNRYIATVNVEEQKQTTTVSGVEYTSYSYIPSVSYSGGSEPTFVNTYTSLPWTEVTIPIRKIEPPVKVPWSELTPAKRIEPWKELTPAKVIVPWSKLTPAKIVVPWSELEDPIKVPLTKLEQPAKIPWTEIVAKDDTKIQTVDKAANQPQVSKDVKPKQTVKKTAAIPVTGDAALNLIPMSIVAIGLLIMARRIKRFTK